MLSSPGYELYVEPIYQAEENEDCSGKIVARIFLVPPWHQKADSPKTIFPY